MCWQKSFFLSRLLEILQRGCIYTLHCQRMGSEVVNILFQSWMACLLNEFNYYLRFSDYDRFDEPPQPQPRTCGNKELGGDLFKGKDLQIEADICTGEVDSSKDYGYNRIYVGFKQARQAYSWMDTKCFSYVFFYFDDKS